MKTRAVRMYGKRDARCEEFDLPEIKDDEILVKVISDSICMSTYKLLEQGKKHKRARQDMETHPAILGHEFAGVIMKVGKKWQSQFKPGMHFAQQPALNYKGSLASPGYSYEFFGGDCTYCIFPREAMEVGALLPYEGDTFFEASLGEPMSCVISGYHSCYHTNPKNHEHIMGPKKEGSVLILGGCGPMGLGAVSYGIHTGIKQLVVTDINDEKLNRAKELISPEYAKKYGVELIYINSTDYDELMALTDGKGYDDVFVYAPIESLAELGNKLLGFDGCMNVFAGPVDSQFSSRINLYNCHYMNTHVMGISGATNEDLIEANELAAKKITKPAVMITHVGGLDSAAQTTLNLPKIPGGKKLVYTHIDMPMTAISDFGKMEDPFFKELDACCQKHNGLWNKEAEKMLLEHYGVNTTVE